ncbi:MAG: ATP-binding protein [Methylotetracoccus sp.]|jgi:serine/threonine-protein kinase RsbW|nr:ATP-binding protein [Methylotetracoccus sp.]
MGTNSVAVDIVVPSRTEYLALVGSIAECLARSLEAYSGDREALAFDLNVVLTEAVMNAIQHGSPLSSPDMLRVRIDIEGEVLSIRVHDSGQGFVLDELAERDPAALEESGRGIFLIRALMDSVSYRKTPSGNVLELKKKLG